MTGSLQIKGNTYYAVLNMTIDGKRKQKWVNTGLSAKCSKKEREKKLREILTQYEERKVSINCDILFADYIKEWLKVAQMKVDEVTYEHYVYDSNLHIIPYFEKLGIKLVDVNREVLQQYFNEKFKSGRVDGNGGLSPKTLRHFKNVINQTLGFALKNELIVQNPCQFVELPKVQRYDYKFYNLDEINALFDAIKDERLYSLYLITSMYGLRKSEALGIKWDSIDLEAKRLTIKHTVVKSKKIIEKDKTKNQSSYRSFPLTDEICNLFIRMKNDEIANKKLFGKGYNKNEYVFKWEDGTPYRPDYITSKHRKILKKYGFRHIRFHELRHSCATLLNAQGFTIKDIQEWLGHSDIQTTANTYAHLDIKRKESISQTLSNVIKM